MTSTLPTRRAALACGVLTLTGLLTAVADDKKPAPPTGTWAMKDGETVVEFAGKGVLKIFPHGDKFDFAVVCEFTAGKDGAMKCKITDHDGKPEIKAKAKDLIPIGSAFTFKWTVDGNTGTLADVDGKGLDAIKSKLEGGYEKKM